MADNIATIRQRLELAGYLPEQFGNGNSAADRWREDVTTLLAEIERLRAQKCRECNEAIHDVEEGGAVYHESCIDPALERLRDDVQEWADRHVETKAEIERLATALRHILEDPDATILDSHRDDGWAALSKN